MSTYIIRRLLGIIPLLFGITVVSFFIIRLAPGKPVAVEQSLNPRVSPELRLRLEKQFGLDKPLHVQYLIWMKQIVRLDFGRSYIDSRPVMEKIAERIPLTLGLNLAALVLIFLIAVPLGVRSAIKADSAFDHSVTFLSFLFFAAPTFWLALLFMQFFSIQLGWFPISGLTSLDFEYFSAWGKAGDSIRHLFLPVFVAAIGGFAGLTRYMRSNMIEALRQPYIATARAKGLPESAVLYSHALRNALLPVVTILGLSIPGLLGGSVIFESIFALPGIGRLFYEAVMTRDYPLIMAEVVITAVLTMLGNLIADISYACVDPRISYKER
ncbi:MAG TPA: ABC transporter permease [Candidatus Omnitrophota bacterium]|nr:ABC transporter permease [Candidatus Omnitrophota bacterium]